MSPDQLAAARGSSGGKSDVARWVRGAVVLIIIGAMVFSRTIAVPALGAVLLSLALAPAVNYLCHWGVPRVISAALVMLLLLGSVGTALYSVREPFAQLAERAPQIVKLGREWMTDVLGAPHATPRTKAAQQAEGVQDSKTVMAALAPLASGISHSLAGVGTALILTFFILTSGSVVGRAVLAAVRGRSDRRAWLRVCGAMRTQAAQYLQLVFLINMGVGLVVAAGLALLGVEGAPAFGLIAAVLNFVPVIGALVTATALGGAGLAEHGISSAAFAPVAFFLAVHLLESQLITPHLLGRRLLLNPLIVMLGVLTGAAAWGIGGAFLAVPILTGAKIALDAHPGFRRWGQVLGRGALMDSQAPARFRNYRMARR